MAYERDILDEPARPRRVVPTVAAEAGLVVEVVSGGFVGAVVAASADGVTLRDRHERNRVFRWDRPGGFLVAGQAVTLTRARPKAPTGPAITASGSISSGPQAARTALASRILVEGRHDAELVEHVWGDDLRGEGVVVEVLEGIDHLAAVIATFRPGPGRRLGVLVDHLVAGSKEARIAAAVAHPHVLVTGTPFVDVRQAVRPSVAGIAAWPVVPRGQPWKEGVCAALGAPDPGRFWVQLRNRVRTYADLEPELVGAVERLIDFVLE